MIETQNIVLERRKKFNYFRLFIITSFLIIALYPLRFIEKEIIGFNLEQLISNIIISIIFLYLIAHIHLIKIKKEILPLCLLFIISLPSLVLWLYEITDYKEIYRIGFILISIVFLSSLQYDDNFLKIINKIFFWIGFLFILILGYLWIKNSDFFLINRFKGFGSGTLLAESFLIFFWYFTINMIAEKKFTKRLLYAVLAIMSIMILGATGSRGTLIGFIISIFTCVILFRKFIKGFKMIALLIVIFTCFVLIYNIFYDITIKRFYIESSFKGYDPLYLWSSGRVDPLRYTIEKIYESNLLSLILGHGSNKINLELETHNIVLLHNDYLTIFYNYGIFGLLLWVSFLFNIFKRTILFWKQSLKNVFQKNDLLFSALAVLSAINIIWVGFHTTILASYTWLPFLFLPISISLSKYK